MRYFGPQLNFFHRVVFVLGLSAAVYVLVSLVTQRDPEKERYVWTDLGGHAPTDLSRAFLGIAGSLAVFAILGVMMYQAILTPLTAAVLAFSWSFGLFARASASSIANRVAAGGEDAGRSLAGLWITEDRLWAGLLSGLAVFLMFYFK